MGSGGAYPFTTELGQHDTDKLLTLQKNYERDPKNVDGAWEYFRELNRQGKYLTVIRLYKNEELSLLDRRHGAKIEQIKA